MKKEIDFIFRDENGDEANLDQAEKEEKMFPLPENVIRLLTMDLGV